MKRVLCILLFAASAFGADNAIVIRAARLIDGRGGAVISPATIVVRGNRIESIGGAPPSDAQTIDLGDMTLLPGLIDAHDHLSHVGMDVYRRLATSPSLACFLQSDLPMGGSQ